jgi:hypothetical protein
MRVLQHNPTESGQIADAPLVRANRVSAWRVWQTEHTVGGIQERRKKRGSRGGNCLKGWMLAVPRCSGGFSSEHFWIDGQRLRAARKAPQRAKGRAVPDGCRTVGIVGGGFMNEISRSKRIKNVLSLQVVRERARQPRDGSSGQVSKRSNQRLLERLEAENAQLRDSVVDLMLQIQALRDGAR